MLAPRMRPELRAALVMLLVAACGAPTTTDDATVPNDAGIDATAPDAGIDPCAAIVSPSVETVAMLSQGRYAPAVAQLESGRVLIAGGYDFSAGMTGSIEIYDPTTRTLTPGGEMQPRNFASATRVGARVFVVGGFDELSGSVGLVQAWDETTGAVEPFHAGLASGREAHTATLFPDGRILVAGGLQARGLRFQRSLEIYDPAADAIASVSAALDPPRGFHDAAWIDDSASVLLVGGDSGAGELASAVRFVPATGALVPTANDRAHAGKAVAAALLPSGHVIVTGGASATDGTLADADDYDPSTNRFTPAASMSVRRMAHTLTALGDGRLVALGGWSDSETAAGGGPMASASIEVREADGSWSRLPVDLAVARLDHRAIALDACHVLVVGGQYAATGESPRAPREVELVTIPPAR